MFLHASLYTPVECVRSYEAAEAASALSQKPECSKSVCGGSQTCIGRKLRAACQPSGVAMQEHSPGSARSKAGVSALRNSISASRISTYGSFGFAICTGNKVGRVRAGRRLHQQPAEAYSKQAVTQPCVKDCARLQPVQQRAGPVVEPIVVLDSYVIAVAWHHHSIDCVSGPVALQGLRRAAQQACQRARLPGAPPTARPSIYNCLHPPPASSASKSESSMHGVQQGSACVVMQR